ncbi:MAG: hypothetical protein ACR2OV_10475 [Hyphomicrobiaceae bacterium]
MKILALELVATRRYGEILDFVVSGRSLYNDLVKLGHDLVPRTGPVLVPTDTDTRELLLLERHGDTPRGRVALYLCPICGGIGCGVVSVRISSDGSTFTWEDFALEFDYIDEDTDGFQILPKLGPYRFEAEQYSQALVRGPGSSP